MAFMPRRRYVRARARGSTRSYKKGFAQGVAAAAAGRAYPRRSRRIRRW